MSSLAGVDAPGGEVAGLDQLGQAPLVLGGQQVDLADLAQVHAHAVRRRAVAAARHPGRPAAPATAEQSLVGRVVGELLERQGDRPGARARRRRRRRLVDLLVDADALVGQRVAGRLEDVAGQLDVAQDEGDLLGVDRSGGPPALGELGPLLRVDAIGRGSPGDDVASVPPCCSLLHAAMEPT